MLANERGPRAGGPADKIEYARLLRGQGQTCGQVSAKTSIPKTSLQRYLACPAAARPASSAAAPVS